MQRPRACNGGEEVIAVVPPLFDEREVAMLIAVGCLAGFVGGFAMRIIRQMTLTDQLRDACWQAKQWRTSAESWKRMAENNRPIAHLHPANGKVFSNN